MTDPHTPPPSPPAPPPPRRSRLAGTLFALSLAINFFVLLLVVLACVGYLRFGDDDATRALTERHHSGKKSAADKIAVIHIDGVLVDGLTGFAERQIDQAAQDRRVKAVVVRINSPGGSITASDQLHHRLTLLHKGDPDKGTSGKPMVVSMGALAASGGYYIAMPSPTLYAERTTVTGSIGVFASFPDLTGLSDKIGVDVTIVKKGNVKASGNPFRKLTPEEQVLWQSLVDHAYDQFLAVVKEGRDDKLRAGLTDNVIDEERTVTVDEKDEKTHQTVHKPVKARYTRQLADGGIWTTDQALKYGLIDKEGYLDDAIKEAHDQAQLGDAWEAITYERPFSLSELLVGAKAEPPAALDPSKLSEAATPRLWYLAPQSELAGVLKAAGH
jgi:protease-4